MSKPAIRVSIVIPVYRGETTLPTLIEKIRSLVAEQSTPDGLKYVICESILVHDCGPDRSDLVLEEISASCPFVRVVWLSRNYGQHAATMAGMASASGDWVVTLDADGQHDPADIGRMLDTAVAGSLQLVYGQPVNSPPHGRLRNLARRIVATMIGNDRLLDFNSQRLIDGEIARTLAAYCGNGVHLDVGLFWIVERIASCPVRQRDETARPSSYSGQKLQPHFWSLILTAGARPLRLITMLGIFSLVMAFGLSAHALYVEYLSNDSVQGWMSLLIATSAFSGLTLVALGVLAEYLAIATGSAMGRPLYVISTKPTRPQVRK